ncbi:hypothetical protein [Formosa haliotis]|uniref:hypothetical protein n=1 Tax=Formosa haliotis TaxID=1555194 RepID=UPI000825E223|nr:hypothetical protein [Formosa haliotis]
MQKLKKHIAFKSFTLVLVFTLLTPTLVKFHHIFETHHHEVCHGEKNTHLHTANVDCEFYKFQLNHLFTIPIFIAEIPLVKENHQLISSQYHFISDYQHLPFALRGPPVLI